MNHRKRDSIVTVLLGALMLVWAAILWLPEIVGRIIVTALLVVGAVWWLWTWNKERKA